MKLSFLRDVTVAVSIGQRLVYSLIVDWSVAISFSSCFLQQKLFAMVEKVSWQQETSEWEDQKPQIDLVGLTKKKHVIHMMFIYHLKWLQNSTF